MAEINEQAVEPIFILLLFCIRRYLGQIKSFWKLILCQWKKISM